MNNSSLENYGFQKGQMEFIDFFSDSEKAISTAAIEANLIRRMKFRLAALNDLLASISAVHEGTAEAIVLRGGLVRMSIRKEDYGYSADVLYKSATYGTLERRRGITLVQRGNGDCIYEDFLRLAEDFSDRHSDALHGEVFERKYEEQITQSMLSNCMDAVKNSIEDIERKLKEAVALWTGYLPAKTLAADLARINTSIYSYLYTTDGVANAAAKAGRDIMSLVLSCRKDWSWVYRLDRVGVVLVVRYDGFTLEPELEGAGHYLDSKLDWREALRKLLELYKIELGTERG